MGMCLDGKGKMSVEVRRESFTIHTEYGYVRDADGDLRLGPDSDSFGKGWRTTPHPEFMLEDLDDLIAVLEEAKAYLKSGR